MVSLTNILGCPAQVLKWFGLVFSSNYLGLSSPGSQVIDLVSFKHFWGYPAQIYLIWFVLKLLGLPAQVLKLFDLVSPTFFWGYPAQILPLIYGLSSPPSPIQSHPVLSSLFPALLLGYIGFCGRATCAVLAPTVATEKLMCTGPLSHLA